MAGGESVTRRLLGYPVGRLAVAIGLVALSLITGAAFIVMTGLTRGDVSYLGIDGARMLEAARAWRHGQDPYANPLFVYAPPALILAGPFALLGEAVAQILLAIVGVALAIVAVIGETRRRVWAIFGVVGLLAFWPFLADLLIGNVTIELSFAMWLVTRRDRLRDGVLLGVLGAAVPKPMLVPFLVWALVWRRSAALGALAAGIATTVVGAVVVGAARYVDWFHALTSGAVPIEFAGNHSISVVDPRLGFLVAAVFVVAFGYVLRTRGPVIGLTWALGVGILVSPYAADYALLPMAVGWPSLLVLTPGIAISGAALGMLGGVLFYPVVVLVLFALLLVRPSVEGPAFDPEGRTIGAVLERTGGR